MPFPFFAHQAAVLPFKLRWPRLSGTGLVLGSMAPDFGYFLVGASATRGWHRPWGVLALCLPVAMVIYLLLTRVVAAPVARHLPRLGTFRLRELAYLEAQPRTIAHLALVAACIVAGGATHLAWDVFTHHGSWMGNHIPWLERPAVRIGGRTIIGSSLLWMLSTLIGGSLTLVVLHRVGRDRLVRAWAEARAPGSTAGIDAEAPAALSHVAFWLPVVLVTAGMAAWSFIDRPPGFFASDKATWVLVFLRSSALGFAALGVSTWRERRAWRHRSGRAGGDASRWIDPAA